MTLNHQHINQKIEYNPEAVEVKSLFWLKNDVYQSHFWVNPISLTRNEIKQDFLENKVEKAIIKTLAWGYPNSMRRFSPNNENINFIAQLLKQKNELSESELYCSYGGLMQLEGIGPSTVTKLLFFNGNTFKKSPCLILDERVINSIKTFEEFGLLKITLNPYKVQSYINYLATMHDISSSLNITPEELEIYLFIQNGKKN